MEGIYAARKKGERSEQSGTADDGFPQSAFADVSSEWLSEGGV
jgi:hypothetical protein